MKKTIYITLSIIFWVLIALIAHSLIEIYFLKQLLASGSFVEWTYFNNRAVCALPLVLQIGLLAGGVIIGYIIGSIWWRLVYVEKKHWRFYKKKK